MAPAASWECAGTCGSLIACHRAWQAVTRPRAPPGEDTVDDGPFPRKPQPRWAKRIDVSRLSCSGSVDSGDSRWPEGKLYLEVDDWLGLGLVVVRSRAWLASLHSDVSIRHVAAKHTALARARAKHWKIFRACRRIGMDRAKSGSQQLDWRSSSGCSAHRDTGTVFGSDIKPDRERIVVCATCHTRPSHGIQRGGLHRVGILLSLGGYSKSLCPLRDICRARGPGEGEFRPLRRDAGDCRPRVGSTPLSR